MHTGLWLLEPDRICLIGPQLSTLPAAVMGTPFRCFSSELTDLLLPTSKSRAQLTASTVIIKTSSPCRQEPLQRPDWKLSLPCLLSVFLAVLPRSCCLGAAVCTKSAPENACSDALEAGSPVRYRCPSDGVQGCHGRIWLLWPLVHSSCCPD